MPDPVSAYSLDQPNKWLFPDCSELCGDQTPASYLWFYHPLIWPLCTPRVVDVGRVHWDAMVFVVKSGKAILVFVTLTNPSKVCGLEAVTWGGSPEEKLGAGVFKRVHHLAVPWPAYADEEQKLQQHHVGLLRLS